MTKNMESSIEQYVRKIKYNLHRKNHTSVLREINSKDLNSEVNFLSLNRSKNETENLSHPYAQFAEQQWKNKFYKHYKILRSLEKGKNNNI